MKLWKWLWDIENKGILKGFIICACFAWICLTLLALVISLLEGTFFTALWIKGLIIFLLISVIVSGAYFSVIYLILEIIKGVKYIFKLKGVGK